MAIFATGATMEKLTDPSIHRETSYHLADFRVLTELGQDIRK